MKHQEDFCLEHNNPEVQKWFRNVGIEETYRQAVLHDNILPEWNDKFQTLSHAEAKNFMSNFIPANSFKYENIRTIINSLPVGSQAAFWRNTFYFKDAITKGELGEEAFHAIISEIFTDSQREEFYSNGASLISNLDERVSNALKSAPETYIPLTNKDREERVIEEHVAELFRPYFIENTELSLPDAVKKFFTDLFETIKEFFGFADTNRNYIDALFNDIVNGKYRNSNVIFSENVTPSTYLIVGKNNSGLDQTLSETESEQILRNLVGNFFKIKYETSDLDHNELIEETIRVATEVYNELDPVVARAFTQKTFTFNPNLGIVEEIDSPEYLELIDELKKRIKRTAPYMFDAIEEDQGDDVSDENFDNESEYANIGDLTSGADEAGFSKISSWVKEYIGSVGVPVKTISLKNGSEFEWTEAVDGNKIYYGLARALNNTKNDFERLVTLINYSTIDGNYAANAFLNKLLKDIGGTQETINNILNDYNGIYKITKDANVINRYIKRNSHVLQNVLKAFDLWSRTSLFQSVSPESGFTSTTDANINSAVRGQINKWQQNSLSLIEGLEQIPNIVESIGAQGDYYSKLNTAINTNNTILKNSLGIEISNDTMKWMLFNNTSGVEKVLTAKDQAFYNGFKDNIKTYGSDLEIKALLNKIKTLAKDGVEKIYDSKDSRLELLAKINGVFDESVYEGSYKSADGKTKYAFQHKTFHLEFVRNLQDDSFITSMMNKGLVKYRVNSKGEDVYLVESQDFIHNNLFMSKMFTKTDDGFQLNNDSIIKKILPHFKLESADGIRQVEDFTIPYKKTQLQEKINKSLNDKEALEKFTKEYAELESLEGRDGDGQTFTNMLTSEFDVYRMNLAVNKTELIEGELLYPHYIGNLEAKRTADFIYLPQIKSVINSDGTMNSNAVKLLKEEIRKEYDRIRRVHQELKTAVENSTLIDGDFTLNSTLARELFKKDVFEKYHTGDVKRKELEGQYVYTGIRALQFTDSVSGILPKSFMKGGLTDAALLNKSLDEIWNEDLLKSHWENTIFQEHFNKINPLSDLLDRRWKTNGVLNRNKVKEFILSSFINTLAFNQLVHGDPALVYKNDGADMYKRFGGRNAAIESSETFITNPSLGIEKVKQTLKYVVADEIKSLNAFDPSISIDQADAQNYATVEYKRYLLWSRGRLTPFLAKALDDIELGKPLSDAQNKIMKENAEYFNVDKTVAFNGLQYLKKSDFILTKELTSILSADALERIKNSPELENDIRRDENNWIARPDMKNKFLHELRQNMEGWRKNSANELEQLESNRYDLYMPISASKMLNVNVFNPSTGWNNISDSVMQIDAKNYGLQLENPSGKDRIIDPSQMIEIIFNEQKDNVSVYYKGEKRNITDLGELYQQYLTQRDKSTFDLAYNELLDENDEFDADNFFPRAVESLINSGADPQTIKIFQSTENGKPEFNPNMAITKDKFKDLLFAWFTKSVLQQKVSGDAKAHVSSFGFTPVKRIQEITLQDGSKDYRWDVVRRNTEEYNNLVYNNGVIIPLNLEEQNKGKVIYDPTLPSDVLRETLKKLYQEGNIYFTDELRHLVPKYIITDVGTDGAIYAPTTYHTESLMSNTRLDDDINENNRYSFGVRIPSQDKHSAVNIEHVDTFPFYYGNSIATAKEIVALSGSDFDIDKLFIHTPELYKSGNQYVPYGSGDKWIEYIKYLNDTNKKFRNLSKGISDVDVIKEILGSLRLPIDISEWKNPYELNNELLELKQLALTNDGTLKDENGIKASYKTSVDLDPLKNLDKTEGNIFTKNGKSIFETTNELPAHMFNTHSLVHEKNTVGKQNINPFVNGNLGLILALRAGYKITPEFQFTISGYTADGFKELSVDNQRVFDTLSSWISAATDEAKEQLNAKYHINLEGAVILKTLISLGFQLDTSVAFVNQPVVQEYLKLKEQNNSNIFLGKKQYKSEADIIESLLSPNGGDVLTIYDNQALSDGLFGNGEPIQNKVLQDLQTINKISSQLSKLTRFLKVKKGFSGGLLQLQQLNEAIDDLGIYLTKDDKDYFELNNPVDTTNTFKYGKNIPQVIQVIKEIVPKMNYITGKLLFDQNSGVIGLKNKIFSNLKSLNDETVTDVTREIDSYIALRLYTEEVDNQYLTDNLFIKGDHATVADSFIKLKEEVNKVISKNLNNEILSDNEKRLLNLAGTSILKRLTVKTNKDKTIDELKLDTFAKLSVDEQDTLITSYGELIKNLSYLSDDMIEFRYLPKQLFAYWVMKDGLQNKFGSIAKLFPVYMFKEHSHSIDKAMSDNSEIFKQIENPDVFYKDVMKKLAKNKTNMKLFPTFYFGRKEDPRIHDKNNTVSLNELERLSDEAKLKLLSQYPFNYTIDKTLGIIITGVPLYVKSSVYNQQENKSTPMMLRLRGFKLYDGTVVRESDENFVNQLEDNILEIEKLDYAVMQTENIIGRSAMTLDMNYSGIKVEQIQEEIDNIEQTKGCVTSL